jgi:light-regulated signal transduction histidine kinase (bacteriophytochrome)
MDSLNGQQVSQIGFNLNITKLIVEQHVAEIEVISAVSDGMKFFLLI